MRDTRLISSRRHPLVLTRELADPKTPVMCRHIRLRTAPPSDCRRNKSSNTLFPLVVRSKCLRRLLHLSQRRPRRRPDRPIDATNSAALIVLFRSAPSVSNHKHPEIITLQSVLFSRRLMSLRPTDPAQHRQETNARTKRNMATCDIANRRIKHRSLGFRFRSHSEHIRPRPTDRSIVASHRSSKDRARLPLHSAASWSHVEIHSGHPVRYRPGSRDTR